MITLTDPQVSALLESLTREELTECRESFANSLYEFSSDTAEGDDAVYQTPHRSATYSTSTGATTLYMPSKGPCGMGIKVVTLSAPRANAPAPSGPPLPTIRPTGALTLFSPLGEPLGFLQCGTLTGFRTALASSILLNRRKHVRTLVVFGAGLQAYWHVRLALMMRGAEIHKVYFISRSVSTSALATVDQFCGMDRDVREREEWLDTKFEMIGGSYHEYPRLVRVYLREADVIICCTPSTKNLFDHAILTSHAGRRKGRLIIAVGSYQPHMRELPEELIHQAIGKNDNKCRVHLHKHAEEGTVIVVDTVKGVAKEAGEVISAGVEKTQMVELGDLIMLRKMDEAEQIEADAEVAAVEASEFSYPSPCDFNNPSGSSRTNSMTDMAAAFFHHRAGINKSEKDSVMNRWLYKGNVIYKSVGMGAMDLAAGMHLIRLAKRKNVGVDVPDF